MTAAASAPVLFDRKVHSVDAFRCGRPNLDSRLRASAQRDESGEPARTFVAIAPDGGVTGYYTVVVAEIDATRTSAEAVVEGLPIPVATIARLAVTEGRQHTGLGRTLLLDALARIARASEEVPARAVLAATLDGEGQAFYRHFGFQPSLLEPDLLMVPMRSVRRVVGI
ncbi:MAG: GNAT family N-acetyltransferase [Solirubrobacterales bacterium]